MKLLCIVCAMVALATIVRGNDCYIRHKTLRGDYFPWFKAGSWDNCYAACAENSGCAAIVFGVGLSKKGRCYMMKYGYGSQKFTFEYSTAVLPCEKLKKSCPSGQKRVGDGKTCSNCYPNTYSKGGAVESCTYCPKGTYSRYGYSSCPLCPVGQYGTGTGAGCRQCSAGTYTNKQGSYLCSSCPKNTYASSSGRSSCTGCPAGTYSVSKATSCISCPVGQFGKATGAGCFDCPPNTYSEQEKSTSCASCKPGFISPGGSSSPDSCIEVLNGAVCWAATVEGRVEDSQIFEDAYLACKGDSKCEAVTCKRNKSETSNIGCSVGDSPGKVVPGGLCRFDIS